jgi:peptide chain release factor subunit 3
MPIIDKYKDMGTVVMGKLESVTIREGDSLLVMPNKVCLSYLNVTPIVCPFYLGLCNSICVQCLLLEQSNVKVIGINLDEKKVRRAGPGENVRVKLSGIEEDDIMAGFVLSSIGKYILQEKLICSLYY